jgi:hypothetical protein
MGLSLCLLSSIPHFSCKGTFTRTNNPFVRGLPKPPTERPVPRPADFNLLGTFERNASPIQSFNHLPRPSVNDKTPFLSTSLPHLSPMASHIEDKMPVLSTSLPNRSEVGSGVDPRVLSNLLENREVAQDTFGNFGSSRFVYSSFDILVWMID